MRKSGFVQEASGRGKWENSLLERRTETMYLLLPAKLFHRRFLIGTSHSSQHRLLVAIDIIERQRIVCHDFPHTLVAGGYYYADGHGEGYYEYGSLPAYKASLGTEYLPAYSPGGRKVVSL